MAGVVCVFEVFLFYLDFVDKRVFRPPSPDYFSAVSHAGT